MRITNDGDSDEFLSKKRLEALNTRLIEAGIGTILEMDTLRNT